VQKRVEKGGFYLALFDAKRVNFTKKPPVPGTTPCPGAVIANHFSMGFYAGKPKK
jgi:hypothetical protein